MLGFKLTYNYYLGMPLLHNKISKSTYNYVAGAIKTKLNVWKASSLSFANRMTLIQSVTNVIPLFISFLVMSRKFCIFLTYKPFFSQKFLIIHQDSSIFLHFPKKICTCLTSKTLLFQKIVIIHQDSWVFFF